MTPTAIITFLAEVTQADIDYEVEKARKAEAEAIREYEITVQNIKPEIRAEGESGRLCIGGGWDFAQKNAWARVKNAEIYVFAAIDLAKHQTPKPARLKIAVINSYDIKDTLKASGYKFSPDGYWVDFIGAKVKAAWVKSVLLDKAADEIEKLTAIGVTIKTDNQLNVILNPTI